MNRSTRAVIDVVAVFTNTTSVAQPPPAANCGSRTAKAPPMPVEIVGTAPPGEIFVMGIVLKFTPRKRKPTTETALGAVTVSVPRKSAGTPMNSSVINFEICCIAGTVTVVDVASCVPSSLVNANVTFTLVF